MQKSQIDKDIKEVLELFPKMGLIVDNKVKTLCGEVDVFDSLNNYVDSYSIKVVIRPGYPYRFPRLFEMGNKFEHIADRHINEDDSCCVCSLQEENLMAQRGISIKSYFLKYVLPYFANQSFFDHEGKWANGDYDHGSLGIFQYYSELLKIENIQEVISFLSFFNDLKLHRNDLCYCGSKKKLKQCHEISYREFRELSKRRRQIDLLVLRNLLKEME